MDTIDQAVLRELNAINCSIAMYRVVIPIDDPVEVAEFEGTRRLPQRIDDWANRLIVELGLASIDLVSHKVVLVRRRRVVYLRLKITVKPKNSVMRYKYHPQINLFPNERNPSEQTGDQST